MPEFKERAAEKQKRKMEELEPYIEKAFARKQKMRELADDEIPNVVALGRMIIQPATPADQAAARRFSEVSSVPLEDPLKKKNTAAQ